MQGIKISCKHKRSLYAFTKNRNDPKAKAHYIRYCKTLRKVIKLSSNITVRFIAKSNNTKTTTWNILKKEMQVTDSEIQSQFLSKTKIIIRF